MNLNDHEEQMDSFEVKFAPKRSVLLLVLCILTWLYCLFLLVYFFGALFNTTRFDFLFGKEKIFLNYKFYFNYLLVPLLCAGGALLMFLGKTIGFWIYTVGQALTVGFSMYAILGLTQQLGAGVFWGILANLFPIAFTIVYATQVFQRKDKRIDVNF